MLVGYARVSKDDGSQSTDLQRDALVAAGVAERVIYEDHASGAKADRPELETCLKSLREGDTLVVWKLDRLGRSLRHLVAIVEDLTDRGVGIKVITGQGAAIDTTTASGKLVFGIFGALAEFERELISERTKAGLASARARGRKGGRPYKMSPAKLRLAMAAMADKDTHVGALCVELDITRQTLYRHVSPTGELRDDGRKLLTERTTTTSTMRTNSPRADAAVLEATANSADPLRCPDCGYRPTRPQDQVPHRHDLETVWLHLDGGGVREVRHCARCQPHQNVQAITCSRCGDGPLLTGAGAATGALPAPVLDWLRRHQWSTAPELVCGGHL